VNSPAHTRETQRGGQASQKSNQALLATRLAKRTVMPAGPTAYHDTGHSRGHGVLQHPHGGQGHRGHASRAGARLAGPHLQRTRQDQSGQRSHSAAHAQRTHGWSGAQAHAVCRATWRCSHNKLVRTTAGVEAGKAGTPTHSHTRPCKRGARTMLGFSRDPSSRMWCADRALYCAASTFSVTCTRAHQAPGADGTPTLKPAGTRRRRVRG
jgi:hypothetical protein